MGAWLGARGICRPSIYSVSRATPTYSTDDWGDLSHLYLKIITINIKLRFKDRKFSRDDFFVTGLSAACAVCFTVQCNAVNTGSKWCIEGVCVNGVSILSGLTLKM